MQLFTDNDCKDIKGERYSKLPEMNMRHRKFDLTMLLIGLQLYCIKKLTEDKKRYEMNIFSFKDRKELVTKIKDNTKKLEEDLLRRSPEDLKYLHLAMYEYESTLNSNGKIMLQSLAEAIIYYYKCLAAKDNKKKEFLYSDETQYKEIITQTKVNEEMRDYLTYRKNSEYLHRISEGVTNILDSIKEEQMTSNLEKRLAVQEALRLSGEYLKSTTQTPNLTEDVISDLETENKAIKELIDFRNLLTHGQLFPFIEDRGVEEIIDKGLPALLGIIQNKMINLENQYINEKLKKIEDKYLQEMLLKEKGNEGIVGTINAISLAEVKFKSISNNDRMIIDEINENYTWMKNEYFSKRNSLNDHLEINVTKEVMDNFLKTHIESSKIKEKLYDGIWSEVTKNIKELESEKYSDFENICKTIVDGKKTEDQLKSYLTSQLEKHQNQLFKTTLDEDGVTKRINEVADTILDNLKMFYSEKIKTQLNELKEINNPSAVRSQLINFYDMIKRQDKLTSDKSNNKPEAKNVVKTRNFFSHGNMLITAHEDIKITENIAKLFKEGIIAELENQPKITLIEFEAAIDTLSTQDDFNEMFGKVSALLCSRSDLSRRKKRSDVETCLTWEEIDEVTSEGPENRDPDNIVIDSEKFTSNVINEFGMNEEKFLNFIKLASESEVIGGYANEVKMLIDSHQYSKHLQEVGKLSGMVMHGMILKDIVGELLNGDYEHVAINLGFLATGKLLEKTVEKASLKGTALISKGGVFLGKSLKLASPFISRGLSVVIAFDLYNELKEYKRCKTETKDDTNEPEECKEYLAAIIGDSIQLAVDSVTLGIDIGAVLGSEILAGVSSVAGPIGMAVGVLVFVGMDVYSAVKKVEKIDKVIHLTGWEKFSEGWRAFFHQQPSEYLQTLVAEKNANNAAVNNAISFLKNNTYIQRYVFPSIIAVKSHSSKYIFHESVTNVALLSQKVRNIQWIRYIPGDQEGIDFFCLPKGDYLPIPNGGTYVCINTIGVEYKNNRTANYTLINLGAGTDKAVGFVDNSNIFVLGRGVKNMTGGNKDDLFILEKNPYLKAHDNKIVGVINGSGGINSINVQKLAPHSKESVVEGRYEVFADFTKGVLKDTYRVNINMTNIHKFIGGEDIKDRVVCACDTNHVDGNGGENENYLDIIEIPNNNNCFYNLKVIVHPYTKIINNAAYGNFFYFVNGETRKNAYIDVGQNLQNNNTVIFNYMLTDVAAVSRSEKNLTFSFAKEFFKRENKVDENSSFNLTVSGDHKNITRYYLTDNTQIEMGIKNVYAIQNTKTPIESLIRDYSSLAYRLKMYVFVHSNDEILAIGHDHKDVLNNHPKAKVSHLVGNGGDNFYVVTSGQEKLLIEKLPISDVIIYDFDDQDQVNMLDLREIQKQVKEDIGQKVETEVKKIGNDLVISLFLNDSSKSKIVKITLRDALDNNWYKRMHVIADYEFVIEDILGYYRLAPKPLLFNDESKSIYIINSADVMKGSKIMVNKKIGEYTFARDNDSLILTNSLSSNADNNTPTLILNDFFYKNNQDKMQTLVIQFNDKIIFLKKEIIKINDAEDYNKLRRKFQHNSFKAIVESIKERKLFEAVEKNNINEIKKLFHDGVSVNARNSNGQTALHYTANIGIAKYLIEKGINFNEKDNFGCTPLHSAASNNRIEIVKYLIDEKGANFYIRDNAGHAPLHSAAISGGQKVLQYLLKRVDVDFTVTDNNGHNILHLAAINDQMKTIEYLVEEKIGSLSIRDKYGNTALHLAAHNGSLNIVKYLVDKGADYNVTNYWDWLPLHSAADGGKVEIVAYFINNKKVDVNMKTKAGNVALHLAAFGDLARNYEENLIDLTALNYVGWTPLYFSAGGGRLRMVKYLLDEADAYIDVKDVLGWELLHFAAYSGSLDIVKYLIDDKGLSINVTTDDGTKPLHFAAYNGNLEMVKYFINDKYDDLNARNNLMWVPLHFAAFNGNLDVVNYFVKEKNADIYVRDYYGQTPLHLAAFNGKLDVVEYLVDDEDMKFNINNSLGWTPLHLAACSGKIQVVKYLIEEKRADIIIRDKFGLTPLYFAALNDKLDVVKYLIENGAKFDLKVVGPTLLEIQEKYKDLVDFNIEKLVNRMFEAVKYNDDFNEAVNVVNQGVSIDTENSDGQTVLHFAAGYGRPEIVKHLVEKERANVSIADANGHTPFHLAAFNGRLEVMKYLTEEKGIDFDLPDKFNLTPLELAKRKGFTDVVKYLEKKHAERKQNPKRIRRHLQESDYKVYYKHKDISLGVQPQITAKSNTQPFSWINVFADTIVNATQSISQFISSSFNQHMQYHEISNQSTVLPDINNVSAQPDINGGILLTDVLLAKKGKRKIFTPLVDNQISSLEAQAYTLSIINEFRSILKQASISCGISVHQLKVNFQQIQTSIFKKIMNGDYQGVSKILHSAAVTLGETSLFTVKQKKKLLLFLEGKIEQLLEKEMLPLIENANNSSLPTFANKIGTSRKPIPDLNKYSIINNNSTQLIK